MFLLCSPVPPYLSAMLMSIWGVRANMVRITSLLPFPAAHMKAVRPSRSGSSLTEGWDRKTPTVSYLQEREIIFRSVMISTNNIRTLNCQERDTFSTNHKTSVKSIYTKICVYEFEHMTFHINGLTVCDSQHCYSVHHSAEVSPPGCQMELCRMCFSREAGGQFWRGLKKTDFSSVKVRKRVYSQ